MYSCNYKGNKSYGISSRGSAFKNKCWRNMEPMLNGEQVNDPIEEDDHIDNVVEDDGTNTLILDSFNAIMDDDDDNDHENIDDFDDVHDIPLIEKAYEPLYEGSNTNILSIILLIINLKVMNGLSDISVK